MRVAGEDGTGLIGTLTGFVAFLLFLLVSVHVLVYLYATSVVTAAAFDAARIASGSDAGPGAQAEAQAHASSLLGRWGSDVELTFTEFTDTDVVLQVRATSPVFLPRRWSEVTGIGQIERDIRIRRETFR